MSKKENREYGLDESPAKGDTMRRQRHLEPVEDFFLEQLGGTITRSARILLAEDDREMRSLLAWTLEDNGYEVVEAENGLELVRCLSSVLVDGESGRPHSEYDVIVSDVRMPGMTGLEVLKSLRKRDHLTPIILITAFGDEETHAEAKRLGAAMIDKPFDTVDLLAAVRRALAF
jgi:DNA-binding response OmpR family regulator